MVQAPATILIRYPLATEKMSRITIRLIPREYPMLTVKYIIEGIISKGCMNAVPIIPPNINIVDAIVAILGFRFPEAIGLSFFKGCLESISRSIRSLKR